MKKAFIYIISLFLLGLGLTACDEDFNKEVAPPQSYEQEDAKDVNFQVALAGGLASPISLNDMEPESMVQAISVTATPTLPEGATLAYKLEVSKTSDFADPVALPATGNDKTVSVTVADLDKAVQTMYGKAPEARPFYIRTFVYIVTGTSAVLGNANIIGPATVTPISISPDLLYLYIPGNHQGWNPATAPQLYTENMDMVYTGFAYLDGEYKYTSAPDWDHTNYGNGGEGLLSDDGGAGNLNAPAGFYYLKADLNLLTYTQTATVWGLIGDATPGGWDNSTPMTYDRASNTWTVTTDMSAGSFKFRANNEWTLNLGGNTDNLTFDGDNITIEAGNYTFTLTLTNPKEGYTCTVVKN
ncbi:SusF/SusE family outer membrane protein [Parabacteroides sp. OttesenSCG-928-G06]|nr:SusF/SusE family outer membrane protein [Parabacteroides sp. OttesenSCG-928-K15]MDL2281952.1 SusF/SusE family outer membrane protein [Parabacteroides sp. OttesenSCG-928-G06]